MNSIVDAIDSNNYTAAVYLDFQKAFGVVDIYILLDQFKRCGNGGRLFSSLSSICSERKQALKINNKFSDLAELRFWGCQGGVLDQ